MKLVAEIRRRKVFRAFMIYVATAWFLLGVFDLAFETWGLPEQTLRYVWIAVLAGFPCVITLVWLYDITDEGIVRTAPASPGEQIDLSLQVSDYIILTIFLLVLCAIGYQLATSIMGAGVDAETEYDVGRAPPKSIAVLPFEDISPAGDQAYLANGIADELRLELQHLEGLRVSGRTSSNAYAGEDGKTIGKLLNVESILEGSVRKDGDDVRITVQLTNAADGFTIWSESYNRKLEKIFEMQEEIATSVAGALGVTLGVGDINAFRGAGTQNIEAYESYLLAYDYFHNQLDDKESLPLMERAVELDPNYAVAWSGLATRVLHDVWDGSPDQMPDLIERGHQLALRAVELNPDSAAAQGVLGIARMVLFDWIGAEQALRRASELLVDRPNATRYGVMLMRSGRLAEAQRQFDIAVTSEPLGGRPAGLSWHASLAQGRIEEARERRYFRPGTDLFEDKLDLAFNEKEPDVLTAAIHGLPETNLSYIHLYAPLLSEFDSRENVLHILREVYQDESLHWPRKLHDIAMAAAYFADPEFALQVKAEDIRTNPSRLVAIWYPVMSEVRQLTEFRDLVTELNLVEYWRAYGWADACRSLGADDFECF